MHYADETLLLTIHAAGPNQIIAVRTISELGTSATSRVSDTIREHVSFQDRDGLTICVLNIQSLRAHSGDVETDDLICRSDILALTETWMDHTTIVDIVGYDLVSIDACPVSDGESSGRRVAGGVAIYRSRLCKKQCAASSIITTGLGTERKIGSSTCTEISLSASHRLKLMAVYIHPQTSKRDIQSFLTQALLSCSVGTDSAGGDGEIPFIISGDFNLNIVDNPWLCDFMMGFGLNYIDSTGSTTLGGTKIDHTFAKNIEISSKISVSYFSYHKPIFLRVTL